MSKSYSLYFNEKEKTYSFTTDNSITYRVILTERKELIADYPEINLRIIELAFYPDKKTKSASDKRIEATIVELLKEVFSKIENALLVIYDSTDGRHRARKILFHKWFIKNNDIPLEKINFELETGFIDIKGMFLFRKDHPQHDMVLQMANEIKDEMQSYK